MRATRKADPHARRRTGRDLTPIFDEYLLEAAVPTLDLEFVGDGQVAYRWTAGVQGFNMPIKVGRPGAWQTIVPTTEWQVMSTPLSKDEFEVAADLYYVNVSKQ